MADVCVELVCVFCQQDISAGTPYSCDVYDGEGTCWHADCPERIELAKECTS